MPGLFYSAFGLGVEGDMERMLVWVGMGWAGVF